MSRTSILVRLGHALIVMAVVALLTFLLIDLAPGSYLEDLATNLRFPRNRSIDRMRVQFGLDQPFYQKVPAVGAQRGRRQFRIPVRVQASGRTADRRASLEHVLLNVIALTAAWTLGLALGLAAAASRGSPIDWAIGAVTTILLASRGVVVAVLLLAGAAQFGTADRQLVRRRRRSTRPGHGPTLRVTVNSDGKIEAAQLGRVD